MADEDDELDDAVEDTEAPPSNDTPDQSEDIQDAADEGVDKELEDSDAAGNALAQSDVSFPPAGQANVSVDGQKAQTQTPLDRYQQFLNTYSQLQKQRQNSDVAMALAGAGAKIGQSMAGRYSGNFVPDLSALKMAQAAGERPVQDFEQAQVVQGREMQLEQEQASNDPTSPQSKLVRQYLNQRLGMDLPDNVSASDAMLIMKTAGRPVMTKYQKGVGTATVNGTPQRVQASYNPQSGTWMDNQGNALPDFVQEGLTPFQYMKDEHGNIIQVSKSGGGQQGPPKVVSSSAYKPVGDDVVNFQPDKDQRKALDDEQKRVDGITKDARTGLQAADNLERALQSGSKLQGSILKTTIPHMVGFNGRMSPLEQNMWAGSQSWNDRFNQFVQTASSGTLTEANKQEAQQLIKEYRQGVAQNLEGITLSSQNKLQQVYSIPKSFSGKVISVPKTPGAVKYLKEKQSGKTVPIKADKYDDALASGLFDQPGQ